jgi:hypothetical protein
MEMVELQPGALAEAVTKGRLGPTANEADAIYLVSTIIVGVLSQTFANEPDLPLGRGPFHPDVRHTDAPLARRLPTRRIRPSHPTNKAFPLDE